MKLTLVRHCCFTLSGTATGAALGLAILAITTSPASALVTAAGSSLIQQLKENSPVIEIAVRRGGAVRRTTVVGPRGEATVTSIDCQVLYITEY